MTTACKPETSQQVDRREFEAELDAFAKKVQNVIEKARSKMTDEEREKADQEAKIIFDRASADAKSSRHTALNSARRLSLIASSTR